MSTLSLRNKIGYAAGDFGNMLSFGMSSTFLLVFYVDVIGITAAAAGTLFLIARIWDAINDPMMGAFADKLFAKRKGKGDKFRPFILQGCWMLAISSVLVFWMPDSLSGTQQLIWAYFTYILWGMCYTFVNIPYGSVASAMTQNPEDRAALAGARTVGSVFGSSFSKFIIPIILGFYSQDAGSGYFIAMVCMAIMGVISHLICYFNIQENVKTSAPAQQINALEALKAIPKNKPLLCVSLASFLILLAVFVTGSTTMFFIKENLDNALWVMTAVGAIELVSIVIAAMSLPKLIKRFGTKRMMILVCGFSSLFNILAFFVVSEIYTFIILFTIINILNLIPLSAVWAQVSDSIEYNQYLTGNRQEGIIYASYSLMRKIGGAGAGFLAAIGIGLIGYDPSLAMQSETTLMGIQFMMFGFPVLCFALVIGLYKYLWILTPEKNAEILAHNAELSKC